MSLSGGSASGDLIKTPRDLEHPFLKVPFESLSKTFRQSQKSVEKDMSTLEKVMKEIGKKKQISKEDACKYLEKVVHRLRGVKRKLEETDVEEEEELSICRKRIEHLETYPISSGHIEESQELQSLRKKWDHVRLNRILVDYFLRQGYYDSAVELSNSTNINDFVDVNIFVKSRDVIEGLKKRDCKAALEWCVENKSRLKRVKSNLEFNLQLQEFIELVREGKYQDAIQYARKKLIPLAEECESQQKDNILDQVRQAMATLAFGKNTKVSPYKEMFACEKWDALIQEFQHDNFLLYSLTTESLLHINLQAGLSALKTPQAFQPEYFNVNDPICHKNFQVLAENLPFSFHLHSKLVCRITGKIMDDRNPPMVLPNGNVYSLEGLQSIADKSPDKKTIKDPRTQEVFRMDELKKSLII